MINKRARPNLTNYDVVSYLNKEIFSLEKRLHKIIIFSLVMLFITFSSAFIGLYHYDNVQRIKLKAKINQYALEAKQHRSVVNDLISSGIIVDKSRTGNDS